MSISQKVVDVAGAGLTRRSSRRGFLFRSAVVGSALAVNPFKFAAAPRNRVRLLVRARRELFVRLDGLLLLDQQRQQFLPARQHPCRLVEDRSLELLQRWPALHPRLQRQVRVVRLRGQRDLQPRLLQLRLPLRYRLVRPAPRVLQPVPVRAVPPGDRVRRPGRVPRCIVPRRRGSSTRRARPRPQPRTRPRCTRHPAST